MPAKETPCALADGCSAPVERGSSQLDSHPDGGTVARVTLPGAWRSPPGPALRRTGCVLVATMTRSAASCWPKRTAIIVCLGDPTSPSVPAGAAAQHRGLLSKPQDLASLTDRLAAQGVHPEPAAAD